MKEYQKLTNFRKVKSNNLFDGTYVQQFKSQAGSSSSANDVKLPPELLILNRYGIGYPYLKAAWQISCRYNIPTFEVLIASGVISEAIWIEAQGLLAQERAKVRQNSKTRKQLLDGAINGLRKNKAKYSAAKTFTMPQLLILFCVVLSISFFAIVELSTAIFITILCLTFFYASNILLRSLLLADYGTQRTVPNSLIHVDEDILPVYTILVALYREPGQVQSLASHLWQLNWPKDKLDIKLVCEADDLETIAAIKDEKLPECFDLVLVPPSAPRTKPKALNYALPMVHGKYLVLYDAEDRPSPDQLREAYSRFLTSSTELACVQAPLRIHNHNQNWLCKMFAIEYLTLFEGILPVLAKWRVPLPLGGTSNHFNGVR